MVYYPFNFAHGQTCEKKVVNVHLSIVVFKKTNSPVIVPSESKHAKILINKQRVHSNKAKNSLNLE